MVPTVSTMAHITSDVPETNHLAPAASSIIAPTVPATTNIAADIPTMNPLAAEAPAVADFPSRNIEQKVLSIFQFSSFLPRSGPGPLPLHCPTVYFWFVGDSARDKGPSSKGALLICGVVVPRKN